MVFKSPTLLIVTFAGPLTNLVKEIRDGLGGNASVVVVQSAQSAWDAINADRESSVSEEEEAIKAVLVDGRELRRKKQHDGRTNLVLGLQQDIPVVVIADDEAIRRDWREHEVATSAMTAKALTAHARTLLEL